MHKESIILEIQTDALDGDVSVAALLRKSKAAATKLAQDNAIKWIDLELNGYQGCTQEEIPAYRVLSGTFKALNPYNGWISVQFPKGQSELIQRISKAPISQSIGSLEASLNEKLEGGVLAFPLNAELQNFFRENLNYPFEVNLLLERSEASGILDAVRNLLLDWSLNLEQAGILGEGLSFSMSEKQKADSITQNIFAQNVGHIGHNSGSAAPSIVQTQTGDQNIDQRKLESFLDQTRKAIPILPIELQDKVETLVDELSGAELAEEKNAKLKSLRAILEGASGNLAAQGIIQLISSLI